MLLLPFTLVFLWLFSEKQMPPTLESQLNHLVEGMILPDQEDPIFSAILCVKAPGFFYQGAAGLADGKQEPMSPNHKIKIASISKIFTACLVLQLMEEGLLNLDDTLDQFLDNDLVRLDRLHIYQGQSYGRKITIQQLLHHSSGIADYMEDPQFIQDVSLRGEQLWTPEDIMATYYRYKTNQKALFIPGTGFHYSDVNFVLLAMIIEKVTGTSLQNQLRKRIFDPLGMTNSYLEYYESPRGMNSFSHAFYSTIDLNGPVNTSFDWGGGGIVSTCEELTHFLRVLLRGELFKRKTTLQLMLRDTEVPNPDPDLDFTYGLGIMKRQLQGYSFFGHGGAYDCDVYYCPELDFMIFTSLNQMNTHGLRDQFLNKALLISFSKISVPKHLPTE